MALISVCLCGDQRVSLLCCALSWQGGGNLVLSLMGQRDALISPSYLSPCCAFAVFPFRCSLINPREAATRCSGSWRWIALQSEPSERTEGTGFCPHYSPEAHPTTVTLEKYSPPDNHVPKPPIEKPFGENDGEDII